MQAALVALQNLAEDIHNHNAMKLGHNTESFLAHHANLSSLDGDQTTL